MNHNRRVIYQGQVVDLGLETVTPPRRDSFELEIVRHPGGAAIAAIDHQRRLCLLRQYRHAAGGWIWELPAGKLEDQEPPLEAAKRELQEEAGVLASEWTPLGFMWSTPGFCDERIYLFLAQSLTLGETTQETNEIIEVHWIAIDTAVEMALSGGIDDAKTIAALFRAAPLNDSKTSFSNRLRGE
jgi:ADP-ribose pyrophosphatase